MEILTQILKPVYDQRSKILILGSFPSVKSREQGFYYGNPQNRFWKVISGVMKRPTPETVGEKRMFLLSNGIALWDVIESCSITGSDDNSIRDVVPADLSILLNNAPIERIYTNGLKAHMLYRKHCEPKTGIPAISLPSTSPANAAWSVERLIEAWNIILQK